MSFAQFLSVLRARARLVLAILLGTLTVAVAVTLLLPKRYDAVASVVVDPKSANPVGNQDSSVAPTAGSIVSTHLDIMGSPTVALRVIETLKLESNPRVGELLGSASPVAKVKEFILNLLPGDEKERPASLKDWMSDRMLANLRLAAGRDSRLIKVVYSSPDPQFSAAIANGFVKAYLETLLQLRVGPVKQSESRFDSQLQELRDKLESAQTKVTKFQQEKGIVATDERMDTENSRLSDLSTQLVAAQGQTYASRAKQSHLREFLAKGGGEAPPEVLNSPAVQQLKQEVTVRQAKMSELSTRIGPNHPQYKTAAEDLARVQKQLNEEMRIAGQGVLVDNDVAGQSEGAIRGAMEAQRGKVFKMKADRTTLAMLMQEVDGAQRAYNNALDRFTQAKVQSDIDGANGSIVDFAAVPSRVASPRTLQILGIALAIGLVLGIGIALFFETIDRHVRSERDIIEIFDLPVLAVLSPRGLRQQAVPQLQGPGIYALPKP